MPRSLTITYRSCARLTDPVRDISEMLAENLESNRAHGITGVLFYDGQHFLQTFEGPAEATRSVLAGIMADQRHQDGVPFGIHWIDSRRFPKWAMKFFGPKATARIVPDMAELDFSDDRLQEIHEMAKQVARRPRRAPRFPPIWRYT